MWMRGKAVIGVGLFLVVILFILFSCLSKTETINTTATGRLYDMSKEGIEVPCNISVEGEYYTSALQEDAFSGKVLVEADQLEFKTKIVKLKFSDGIAVPVTEDELGYQYTSRIHSIIKHRKSSEFVVVLYNKYEVVDGKLIASINETNPLFICIGKISKEDALNLIFSYFR